MLRNIGEYLNSRPKMVSTDSEKDVGLVLSHKHRDEPEYHQVSLIISLRKKAEIWVPWLQPLTQCVSA